MLQRCSTASSLDSFLTISSLRSNIRRSYWRSCWIISGGTKLPRPGAGAAGGLGYAFLQYFNAEARPGAELLLDEIGFDALILDADLVITGEGHSDRQTLMGKLPQRILEHVTNQKIWLVSGGVSDRKAMLDAGFDRVVQVTPEEMPLDEAMKPEVARNNIIKAIREQFAL